MVTRFPPAGRTLRNRIGIRPVNSDRHSVKAKWRAITRLHLAGSVNGLVSHSWRVPPAAGPLHAIFRPDNMGLFRISSNKVIRCLLSDTHADPENSRPIKLQRGLIRERVRRVSTKFTREKSRNDAPSKYLDVSSKLYVGKRA